MELKSYALQWLRDHDKLNEERLLCVLDLFETLDDQEQTSENLKNVLSVFASIVASYYNGNDDDW